MNYLRLYYYFLAMVLVILLTLNYCPVFPPYIRAYHTFLTVCLLTSLLVYREGTESYVYLKFFPPFLFLTLIVEIWGAYTSSLGLRNAMLYNLFFLQWVCIFLGILSIIIKNSIAKKIVWGIIVLFAAYATINGLYIRMKTISTVTNSLGCLLIVIVCIYYFLELFRQPKSVDLRHNPAFWICTGLLFYCCCAVPLYGFFTLWMNTPIVRDNLGHINNYLNIFLYTLFTIGFLCLKTPKYSSSSS
jgi:uncharacterized membrane protein